MQHDNIWRQVVRVFFVLSLELLANSCSFLLCQSRALRENLILSIECRLGQRNTTISEEGHVGEVFDTGLNISLRDEAIFINIHHI